MGEVIYISDYLERKRRERDAKTIRHLQAKGFPMDYTVGPDEPTEPYDWIRALIEDEDFITE